MRDLGPLDRTQQQITPHLQVTEQLLSQACTEVSRRPCAAEIVTMPDLGLPYSISRMHGGFFTGAHYRWETDVPFVPIDATVNLCGVSLYRVTVDLSDEMEFRAAVERARTHIEEHSSLVWNFTTGNHFVILAETEGTAGTLSAGKYLVLHSSPAEFKKQYNGLYPTPGNWYEPDIKVVHSTSGRYLRFISGKAAERYTRIVRMMEAHQRERQLMVAELIVGRGRVDEAILESTHYGMPDDTSIAIGCQWMPEKGGAYLLLTRPHAPLYLVHAEPGGPNQIDASGTTVLLAPHGLGVESTRPFDIKYYSASLEVAGHMFSLTDQLRGQSFIAVREFEPERDLARVFECAPGRVLSELRTVYSYHHIGGQH